MCQSQLGFFVLPLCPAGSGVCLSMWRGSLEEKDQEGLSWEGVL